MFDAIIRFSLKNRLLVIALTALTVVYGGLALRELPIDAKRKVARELRAMAKDGLVVYDRKASGWRRA